MANTKFYPVPIEIEACYNRGGFYGFRFSTPRRTLHACTDMFLGHETSLDDFFASVHRSIDKLLLEYMFNNELKRRLL